MISPRTVAQPVEELTPEAYLAWERDQVERHEYVAGRVYLLAGGTAGHAQVSMNLSAMLWHHLRGHVCRVFTNELKLQVAGNRYYYPDIVVVCRAVGRTTDVVTEARIVFEIQSPSTHRIDAEAKADAYWRVPSLEAYVMVAQDQLHVTVLRRPAEADRLGEPAWQREILTKPEDVLRLDGIGFACTLAEVYERTGLPDSPGED